MAMLAFHFSGVYKDSLFDGRKTATILEGENYFRIGQEILLYLSPKDSLFDGKVDERIGKGVIEKVIVKKVGELTDFEARETGIDTLLELKEVLKKWYQADENSVVTYAKFKVEFEK